MAELTFRRATIEDCDLIYRFIKELSVYEKLEHEVEATAEILRESLFVKQQAEVFFPMEDGREIGYALYFQNFSTFMGRAGLYLEDVFIKPAYRGKGYGKATLRELARIAVERGCKRLEWVCLDWNKPSIDFYLSLGAEPMSEWTIYRLSGERLEQFAK